MVSYISSSCLLVEDDHFLCSFGIMVEHVKDVLPL